MNKIKAAVVVQKWIRKIISPKIFGVVCAKLQTKNWRKAQDWYDKGKTNECEKYQIKLLKKNYDFRALTLNTNIRMNVLTHRMETLMYPLRRNDGFEWSEDFDCFCKVGENELYFNLKFICGSGGAQTRSLREVYHFMICQLRHIDSLACTNRYFINILDGDEASKRMRQFKHLLDNFKESTKKYVFCGSMLEFKSFWHKYQIEHAQLSGTPSEN